jgi:uncharacterized protein (DUF2126 family)
VQPAYEDTWYYLWRERRLPVNVDPFDARLDDELERARCAASSARAWMRRGRLSAAAQARVAGRYGRPAPGHRALVPARRALYLMPGDSPMGYRLPLDSLPWAAAGDRPLALVQDPFAALAPLAALRPLRTRRDGKRSQPGTPTAARRPKRPRSSSAADSRCTVAARAKGAWPARMNR